MRVKQFLIRLGGLAAGFLGLAALTFAQQNTTKIVDMGYEFTWKTTSAELRVNPMRVRLSNELGKDDEGVLTWQSPTQRITIPVQLPKGSEKVFEFYVSSQGWGEGTLSYDSPARTPYIPINLYSGNRPNKWNVAVVSDGPGGFLDIRQDDDPGKAWSAFDFQDYYVKPGEAPTKSIGYADMDFIFLGEGAERLSDAEVNAIKGATLAGSRLFFMGGAGKPIFSDVRWADILPVQVKGQSSISNVRWLEPYGADITAPILTSTSTPVAGTQVIRREGGQVLMATRGYGVGTANFIAFDLADGVLRKWRGKKGLLLNMSKSLPASEMHQYMRFQFGNQYESYGGYPGFGTTAEEFPQNSLPKPELPSTLTVLAVLGLYVVLVVPLNLLLMRKLGKGELAWITAPVISLAFAGVLFNFSKELYTAQSSKSTTGTVYAAEGGNFAIFGGAQELFIPRAGAYDLGFKGVEMVESSGGDEYYEPRMTDNIEAYDIGEIIVPRYKATNLDFVEFSMVQQIPWNSQPISNLKVVALSEEKYKITGSITNRTNVPWKGLMLLSGLASTESSLEPGETWEIDTTFPAVLIRESDGIFPLKFSAPIPGIGAKIGEKVPDVSVHMSLNVDVTALRGQQ
ncbi:MAG: hypothetical protein R2688_06455 [Fimbriimonadaceae bacterium]